MIHMSFHSARSTIIILLLVYPKAGDFQPSNNKGCSKSVSDAKLF